MYYHLPCQTQPYESQHFSTSLTSKQLSRTQTPLHFKVKDAKHQILPSLLLRAYSFHLTPGSPNSLLAISAHLYLPTSLSPILFPSPIFNFLSPVLRHQHQAAWPMFVKQLLMQGWGEMGGRLRWQGDLFSSSIFPCIFRSFPHGQDLFGGLQLCNISLGYLSARCKCLIGDPHWVSAVGHVSYVKISVNLIISIFVSL